MKIELKIPLEEPRIGIDISLHALAVCASRASDRSAVVVLANKLTSDSPDRYGKMQAFVDELHRRFEYAPDPLKETIGPVPIEEIGDTAGSTIDADDACLFVAALAASVDIPCRLVGARFVRSWTCFVSCQSEDGSWKRIDPLRQQTDREPDELVMGGVIGS